VFICLACFFGVQVAPLSSVLAEEMLESMNSFMAADPLIKLTLEMISHSLSPEQVSSAIEICTF
jgi:glutamine phosphoribosylpyrophosphate amidotransferase